MNPWRLCRCGHSMLLHDVADMDGTDPTCCVEGCDQPGCRAEALALEHDRLMNERARLVLDGVDPDELAMPTSPISIPEDLR